MSDEVLALGYVAAMGYAVFRQTGDEKTAIAVAGGLAILLYLARDQLNKFREDIQNLI